MIFRSRSSEQLPSKDAFPLMTHLIRLVGLDFRLSYSGVYFKFNKLYSHLPLDHDE